MHFCNSFLIAILLICIASTPITAATTEKPPAPGTSVKSTPPAASPAPPPAAKNPTSAKPASPSNGQIAAAFQQYTTTEMRKVTDTYKGNHFMIIFMQADSLTKEPERWIKSITTLKTPFKAEIMKATPQTGVLEVSTITAFFQEAATKANAIAEKSKIRSLTTKYKFTLTYRDGKWQPTSGKVYDSTLNQWFDNEKDIFKALKCQDEQH